MKKKEKVTYWYGAAAGTTASTIVFSILPKISEYELFLQLTLGATLFLIAGIINKYGEDD